MKMQSSDLKANSRTVVVWWVTLWLGFFTASSPELEHAAHLNKLPRLGGKVKRVKIDTCKYSQDLEAHNASKKQHLALGTSTCKLWSCKAHDYSTVTDETHPTFKLMTVYALEKWTQSFWQKFRNYKIFNIMYILYMYRKTQNFQVHWNSRELRAKWVTTEFFFNFTNKIRRERMMPLKRRIAVLSTIFMMALLIA